MTDASIEQHIRETLPTAMPTNTWSNDLVRALLRRLDAARESEKAALDVLQYMIGQCTHCNGTGVYRVKGQGAWGEGRKPAPVRESPCGACSPVREFLQKAGR